MNQTYCHPLKKILDTSYNCDKVVPEDGATLMRDIYSEITDRIVSSLEAGVQPWFQPWKSGQPVAFPRRHNGESYRGVNVVILWIASMEKGYRNPTWMTFNQAKDLGGHVRKGEHGTQIVFTSSYTKDGDDGESRTVKFLKTYTVFNCEQIEGLPEKYALPPEPVVENTDVRSETADAFFAGLGMDLRHGGNKAFYQPTADYVQMPEFGDFVSAADYYCTLSHESIHWTKNEKRLDRDLGKKRWGDEGYAMEELVAEIGAAFVAADLGLMAKPRADHASYIANWLQVLKNDKRAIFSAAHLAEQAASYLHSINKPQRVAA